MTLCLWKSEIKQGCLKSALRLKIPREDLLNVLRKQIDQFEYLKGYIVLSCFGKDTASIKSMIVCQIKNGNY